MLGGDSDQYVFHVTVSVLKKYDKYLENFEIS